MAYIGFENIATTDDVKDVDDLTIPAESTHAELQAVTNHCSYTMDGSSEPDQDVGMKLLTTAEPKLFLIEDIKNIKFHRGAGTDGVLMVHYVGRAT